MYCNSDLSLSVTPYRWSFVTFPGLHSLHSVCLFSCTQSNYWSTFDSCSVPFTVPGLISSTVKNQLLWWYLLVCVKEVHLHCSAFSCSIEMGDILLAGSSTLTSCLVYPHPVHFLSCSSTLSLFWPLSQSPPQPMTFRHCCEPLVNLRKED